MDASGKTTYQFTLSDQLALVLIVLCYTVYVVHEIVQANGGMFTYTLDDVYIHLAVGEGILSGTYGINAGEFSAPSSSILWPFLLAPFASSEVYYLVPLAINIVCACLSIVVIYRTFIVAFRIPGDPAPSVERPAAFILAAMIALAANMLGIIFTGMEHSLQILFECLIFYGLVLHLRTGDKGRMLVYIPAILLPLTRYEGLALSCAVLLVMFIVDSRKRAMLSFAAMIGLVVGFSLFLYANSGWFLPASVMFKSAFERSPFEFNELIEIVFEVLRGTSTIPLKYTFIVIVPGLVYAAFVRKDRFQIVMGWLVASVVLAHFLAFGDINERYMISLYVIALIGTALFFIEGIHSLFRRNILLGGVLVIIVICGVYIGNYFFQKKIPHSAANIYQQHYTMHRFVTEYYRHPVAVNDIGYVSFRNPQYVLDLKGLGNYSVLGMKEPVTAQAMDSLVHAHDVELVMIYEDWFYNIPDWWIEAGQFQLLERNITAANDTVMIYAVDSTSLSSIQRSLRALRDDLTDPRLVYIPSDPAE
ncbi:MAG: hypothetical protein CL946_08545 [Ectothiorhodospiraceae bacterium]|nr:hypothetical protein [Ectothiorhodospiraceae bacterium]